MPGFAAGLDARGSSAGLVGEDEDSDDEFGEALMDLMEHAHDSSKDGNNGSNRPRAGSIAGASALVLIGDDGGAILPPSVAESSDNQNMNMVFGTTEVHGFRLASARSFARTAVASSPAKAGGVITSIPPETKVAGGSGQTTTASIVPVGRDESQRAAQAVDAV
jgi:hypothetical protein